MPDTPNVLVQAVWVLTDTDVYHNMPAQYHSQNFRSCGSFALHACETTETQYLPLEYTL